MATLRGLLVYPVPPSLGMGMGGLTPVTSWALNPVSPLAGSGSPRGTLPLPGLLAAHACVCGEALKWGAGVSEPRAQ